MQPIVRSMIYAMADEDRTHVGQLSIHKTYVFFRLSTRASIARKKPTKNSSG